jgi:hypothetical protein
MAMDELELMSYLRKDIITDGFAKCSLQQILKNSPVVSLTNYNS